jgi:hypothetical protein
MKETVGLAAREELEFIADLMKRYNLTEFTCGHLIMKRDPEADNANAQSQLLERFEKLSQDATDEEILMDPMAGMRG